MEAGDLHPALEPMKWLIGKWKSTAADCILDSGDKIQYSEEITFSSLGQPMLNYQSYSWHPVRKNPMHLESGFLRVKPETNNLAFMVAHNFGLTTVEEGFIEDGGKIKLESKDIGRMSFSKDPSVTALRRELSYDSEKDELNIITYMATTKSPMFEHLKVVYRRA